MNLKDIVKTGDFVFVSGTSWISKIIKTLTSGVVSHTGIIYDETTIFETDGRWRKAQFRPLEYYNDKAILIMRLKELEDYSTIQALCKKYDGTPYSYWDIVTNALFSPLNDSLREEAVRFAGTKKFMICSELIAKILFETTKKAELAHYEGLTPQDLLKICLFHPTQWEVVYQSPDFHTL